MGLLIYVVIQLLRSRYFELFLWLETLSSSQFQWQRLWLSGSELSWLTFSSSQSLDLEHWQCKQVDTIHRKSFFLLRQRLFFPSTAGYLLFKIQGKKKFYFQGYLWQIRAFSALSTNQNVSFTYEKFACAFILIQLNCQKGTKNSRCMTRIIMSHF